jgi:hypothetical protein
MRAHTKKVFVVKYWLSNTGWISLDPIYLNKGSARKRAARVRREGTKNTFSGCGKIHPWPDQVQLFERVLV